MKAYVAIASLLLLPGCATMAEPNFFNGQYYLAGDANCKFMTVMTPTRIMCSDKKGMQTGYRDAMTQIDLQTHAANQQALSNAISQSAYSLGYAIGGGGAPPPQVNSYVMPPQPRSVTYTQIGNSLFGSNGVTYTQTGNIVHGSDGTTCTITGNIIHCR